MKLYCLRVHPSESDGDGEVFDQWFTSLEAAKRVRARFIREVPADEYKFGEDFRIDEVVLRALPHRALLLAVLNRQGWVQTRRTVVEAYRPPPRSEEPS